MSTIVITSDRRRVHDLRPLVIRDRGRRHAVAWLAAVHDVPEHQVIATHAAIEVWTLTELGDDVHYDEGFADWASQQRDLRVVLAAAPERLGTSLDATGQLLMLIIEYRQGVRRRHEGFGRLDEHDPARRRPVRRGRARPR